MSPSASSAFIQDLVRRVRLRTFALRALEGFLWAVLAGGVARLILQLWEWITASPAPSSAVVILGPALITWIAFLSIGWTTRSGAAHTVDQNLGLKDRTLSALDFSQRRERGAIHDLQIQDAAGHLSGVRVRQVVPWSWKRDAGVACAAMLLLFFGTFVPSGTEANALPVPPSPSAVVAIAEELDQQLEELAEELSESEDSAEIKDQIEKARELAKSLEEPGTDLEKALETIGKMRSSLESAARELDLTTQDALMMALADALNQSPHTQPVGLPLSKRNFKEAAANMDRLAEEAGNPENKFPEKSKELGKKAQELSQQAQKAGNESMQSAMQELSDAIKDGNCSACKSGLQKQGQQMKRHGQRAAAMQGLQQQLQQLGQCRSELAGSMGQCRSCGKSPCQGEGQGQCSGEGISFNQSPTDQTSQQESSSAGMSAHTNPYGDGTSLDALRNREEITASAKNFGTSEITTELAPEMEQFVSRDYQEVYSRYKKLSDEALEHEALPLGYQEIIKRYFEGIRPHREELPEKE
jgi:hypothetical protein